MHLSSPHTPAILIADNEPLIRYGIVSAFHESGYEVLEAASVSEAVEILAVRAVDLVVTDMDLCDGCGCKIADEAFDRDARTPVIMISAHERPQDAICMQRGRISAFISKPFEMDALLAQAQALLSDHETQHVTLQSDRFSDQHL